MSLTFRTATHLALALTAACGLVFALLSAVSAAAAAEPPAYRPGRLLQTMLDGDLRGAEEIVFAVRVSGRDH